MLCLRDQHGREVVLTIEAKFRAGLSNQDSDLADNATGAPRNGSPSPGHQLTDDYAALTTGRWVHPPEVAQWFQRDTDKAVLYVTAHYSIPMADIAGRAPEAEGRVSWLGWRSLWEVLEHARHAGKSAYRGYSPAEYHLLDDVRQVLVRRELAGFVSHLGDLQPVEPYVRHVLILTFGRALAPVETYRRQLVVGQMTIAKGRSHTPSEEWGVAVGQ